MQPCQHTRLGYDAEVGAESKEPGNEVPVQLCLGAKDSPGTYLVGSRIDGARATSLDSLAMPPSSHDSSGTVRLTLPDSAAQGVRSEVEKRSVRVESDRSPAGDTAPLRLTLDRGFKVRFLARQPTPRCVPLAGQPLPRSAYFVTCTGVVKDDAGRVVELRCTYDPATRGGDAPDGRRPKATLHWLSAAHALPAEVRLYDHLFSRPDPGAGGDLFADLYPASEMVVRGAFVEASLADAPVGVTLQFERLGYFCPDPDAAPGRLVFNRTLGLKDTWARLQA